MVKIEIRLTFLLTLICGLQNLSGKLQNLSGKLQNLSGKLQNLSGKLQKLSGKLQICGKLQINVSKNVNRISINHKITQQNSSASFAIKVAKLSLSSQVASKIKKTP